MITKVAKDLFYDLQCGGFTVVNTYWESPDEGMTLETEGDVEDTLFEDNEKNTWVMEWRVEGVDHESLQDVIESVYGEPTRTHQLPEKKVNNWDVDRVTIVQSGDSIEFFEYFERVPKKQK